MSAFAEPPAPEAYTDLDELVVGLRLLKAWAGGPSYLTIARRVNDAWAAAGRPERTTKNTVADCFALGRARPSEDLVLGTVSALHPDPSYVARWQRALRIVRGEAVAATFVRVHDRLPSDPDGFTGRSDELKALQRTHEAGVPVAVIVGMAGVGKTQLAVHAAHRFAAEFDRVLYVDLRGFHPEPAQPPADPAAVLDGFLRLLGVAAHAIPHGLERRVALFASIAGSALVVLDNAASAEQVVPLVAPAGCLTLVTSRHRLDLPGADVLYLDVFSADDALTLLRSAAGPARFSAATAGLIADRLGCLPLALGLTASRIRADADWTLDDHLARLVPGSAEPTVDRTRLAGSVRLDDPVTRALDLSYDRLAPPDARSFRLLALHPGGDFDSYALAALAGTDLASATAQLDRLVAANLLRRRDHDRFELHDLVRAYACGRAEDADPASRRRSALGRLLSYYAHTAGLAMDHYVPTERARRPSVPACSPVPSLSADTAVGWLDAERTNLVAVAVHAAHSGWPEHPGIFSRILYRYLDTHGHQHDALVLHGEACVVGPPLSRARALVNLGVAHWRLGRHHDAIARLDQALELYRAHGDAAGACGSLSNLGVVYERLGRYAEALQHDRLALAGYRSLGDRHGEGIALGNLGIVCGKLGRYPSALAYLRSGLAAFREIGDRINEGRMLGNLADACARSGLLTEALSHACAALAVAEEVGNRTGQAAALGNLGDIHQHQGHLHDALTYHRRALALYRAVGNRNGAVEALNGIGESLCSLGSLDAAAAHHREALADAADIPDPHEQARAHAGLTRCTS